METVLTVLTDKEQALVGTVRSTGMPTPGAGLTAVVGIDLDRHALMHQGFVGEHAVQLGKGPLGVDRIGFSLLARSLLALGAASTLANVGQVLQAHERMRMRARNLLTHHMISVLLQPSLSPTDAHQTTGSRASAFALQTLSQA